MNELTERKKRIVDLTLFDDVLFKKVAERKNVCQEILRVLTGDKKLCVVKSYTQKSIEKIFKGCYYIVSK